MKQTPSALAATALTLLVMAACLFIAAGRLNVPAFWAYLFVFVAACLAMLNLVDPDLIRERMRPGGRPLGMRHKLLSVIPAVHLIAAGLDRGRLHWTEISSPALSLLGFVVLIAALGLLVWAMHVNRFFSSVIRIQTERGHCVIDAGPYRWIRHPGYAAGLLLCLASGVALGSSISVAVLLPAVPLLLWRTVAEDKVLRAELAGYSAYASRVRYRLLPLVW